MSSLDARHIARVAETSRSQSKGGAPALHHKPSSLPDGVWARILRILGVGPGDLPVEANVRTFNIDWTRALAVNTSVGMLLAACAANASRAGYDDARLPFYLSIVLFFLPVAVRLSLPGISRTERFANVMIVTFGLFMLRVIRAPEFLLGHDEYLHWVTAQNIVEHHHLFTPNVVFPIGPLFPGLEIVVTAVSELSGLSIFVCAALVLAAARMLFVGALLLFYERITGSARVAALGGIFYTGCSTFVFFDTNFAYESLAQPLLMLALFLGMRATDKADRGPPYAFQFLAAFTIVVLALSVTHHVTAFALAALMLAFVALEVIRGGGRKACNWRLHAAALCAVIAPAAWSWAMGNPGGAYLGPVFENGLHEVMQMLHSGPASRKLFTADDGTVAPAWERFTTLGSVGLVCAGLALGFFRSLSWAGLAFAREAQPSWRSLSSWANSGLVLLTFLTFSYPLGIMFRMTRSGWEIGNRMGPYAFLGVGVVLAIVVSTLLQKERRSLLSATAIGIAATVILIGGIISSEGPRILVPARYRVSADAASIEPMGVEAAVWTRQWLGPGRRFAADRVNRLLLSGFGRQLVSSTLQHGYDAGVILAANDFGPKESEVLAKLGLDYLLVDMRLTTGLPVVGAYFDGAAADRMLGKPPTARAFLKFNSLSHVSRIFDNGYEIVYDVRALSGRR